MGLATATLVWVLVFIDSGSMVQSMAYGSYERCEQDRGYLLNGSAMRCQQLVFIPAKDEHP